MVYKPTNITGGGANSQDIRIIQWEFQDPKMELR